MKIFLIGITATTFILQPAFARKCSNITKEQVLAAQKSWGEGIVAIGKDNNPRLAAIKQIDTLYAYDIGKVLFKPTLAAKKQFRSTKEDALSYFVRGNISEDRGFALAPFTNVYFENEDIIINCNSALAMGNYYFTNLQGEKLKVEYSFGYIMDKKGNLKINLHHSSLPYQPN